MGTHRVTVGDEIRDLPIVSVGAVSVALLNLLGDTTLTEAAADALAGRMPAGVEVLVTPEVKAVPLAHALSRADRPAVRGGAQDREALHGGRRRSTVRSITTGTPQDLVIDGADVPRLRGSVAIVDDVVSTGGTLRRWGAAARGRRRVVATLVLFTEGTPATTSSRSGTCRCSPSTDGPVPRPPGPPRER
jgi:adenine phosphoribosyltransferase